VEAVWIHVISDPISNLKDTKLPQALEVVTPAACPRRGERRRRRRAVHGRRRGLRPWEAALTRYGRTRPRGARTFDGRHTRGYEMRLRGDLVHGPKTLGVLSWRGDVILGKIWLIPYLEGNSLRTSRDCLTDIDSPIEPIGARGVQNYEWAESTSRER
jgi:hypothetical protein